jgi:hypothetical protein
MPIVLLVVVMILADSRPCLPRVRSGRFHSSHQNGPLADATLAIASAWGSRALAGMLTCTIECLIPVHSSDAESDQHRALGKLGAVPRLPG